jgi:DDE superfamily endonuclease
LTTGTASRRARGTCSFRSLLRALDPNRKTRTTSPRPAGMPLGGRLQIGTMAGFKSERVAGFNLECVAGFIGIRRSPPKPRIHRIPQVSRCRLSGPHRDQVDPRQSLRAHLQRDQSLVAEQPTHRFEFTFTPTHGSWLNLIEGFFSKLARSVLRHIRVASKARTQGSHHGCHGLLQSGTRRSHLVFQAR